MSETVTGFIDHVISEMKTTDIQWYWKVQKEEELTCVGSFLRCTGNIEATGIYHHPVYENSFRSVLYRRCRRIHMEIERYLVGRLRESVLHWLPGSCGSLEMTPPYRRRAERLAEVRGSVRKSREVCAGKWEGRDAKSNDLSAEIWFPEPGRKRFIRNIRNLSIRSFRIIRTCRKIFRCGIYRLLMRLLCQSHSRRLRLQNYCSGMLYSSAGFGKDILIFRGTFTRCARLLGVMNL